LSTDTKGAKVLARTFFNQLRGSGYTPTQVIAVASELIDLVTSDLRDSSKVEAPLAAAPTNETRHQA
jgi:hypothetical protein